MRSLSGLGEGWLLKAGLVWVTWAHSVSEMLKCTISTAREQCVQKFRSVNDRYKVKFASSMIEDFSHEPSL